MSNDFDHSFPRILILNSQSFNKNNATGITLRSVLSCIPKDKLLQVYRFKPWNPTADTLDVNSIQIPPKSMPVSYLFKNLFGAVTDVDKEPNKSSSNTKSYLRQNILKIAFKAFLDNSIIIPNKEFLSKVDLFEPEYIYTLGGGICIQKWAIFFAKRYKCKVVTHYMDNWRQTAFMEDKRLTFINKYLNKQLDVLEKRMRFGMVISEAMAEAYKSKYHHEYIPLMNTVDSISVKDVKHDYLTIVYAGGLHLNRFKTLIEVENAIRSFQNVRLVVYSSKENIDAYKDLFHSEITTFKNAVNHKEIASVYESADILLHIESFDNNDIEFTKYSLSTKIPEYMMSGKPIICYAPLNIAVSQYINSSNAGICVESTNDFIEAVKTLTDKKTRLQYGCNGRKTANLNHSKQSTLKVLEQVFMIEDKR